MTLVVDASVAIKWVVEEEGRASARALLAGKRPLFAPDFLLVEFANALRMKVSRGQMETKYATEALATVSSAFRDFVPDRDLVPRALEIALDLQHPVYDCIYLACAAQLDAELVTADERLIGKLQQAGSWPNVHALTD